MKRTTLALLCCLTAACGAKKPTPEPTPTAPTLNVDGGERLAQTVVPQAYRVDLTLDPSKDVFSGVVSIDVLLQETTQAIVLQADELKILSASVSRDGTDIPVDVQPGSNTGLGLAFVTPVEPGKLTITLNYEGPLDEVPAGIYRVKEGDAWYVFTQFEPLEARQAFPSFDEPVFKTPFTTTLRVPTGQLAFANTPEVERKTEGDFDVFRFAESKPIPTYLVAFAAGPLEVLDGGDVDGTPIRLIATQGKAKQGSWILGETPAVLRNLTNYFGEPYPYQKLDLVAVPNFAAGAMENVGLVTFRETGLLLDPESAALANQAGAVSTLAHELAHMWFGNLVTLPWWDEIWLNEGFATWMAAKSLQDLKPELESNLNTVRYNGWVMESDSLVESQAVRQEIRNDGDVRGAFSSIAYGKGRALLDMFEAWLGPDVMRDAVRHYLAKHPHGTGTTESLLASFDEVSGKPVSAAFTTFTTQPGAPLLSFETNCKDGKPTVSVTQSRYLPEGSEAPQTGPWNVPICVSWPQGRETKTHCELIEGASSNLTLPADSCPAWIYPNAQQKGYYRWATDDKNFDALLNPKTFATFDVATKLETFSNLSALSRAGKVDAARYIAAAERQASESHQALVRQAVGAIDELENAVPKEDLPKFQKRAKALLTKHLNAVGFEAKKGEKAERALLRPTVIRAAATLGKDAKTIAWAKKIADEFAKDMSSVKVENVQVALPIAAQDADAARWLSYKLLLTNVKNPLARRATLSALGSVQDPQLLRRSLDLFFTDDVRAQDLWSLAGPSFGSEETYAVMWTWFTENFEAIAAKKGKESVSGLPSVGSGFCDPAGAEKVKTFFADPAHQAEGYDRALSDTLEEIAQCQRRREYLRSGLGEFY